MLSKPKTRMTETSQRAGIIPPLKCHIIKKIHKLSILAGKQLTVSTSLQSRVKDAERQLMNPEEPLAKLSLKTEGNLPSKMRNKKMIVLDS